MLVIRLARTGKKGEKKFRIVVKEKRDKRDGKALENLGWYVKTETSEQKHVNTDRLRYWISVGAQPSPTVKKIAAV